MREKLQYLEADENSNEISRYLTIAKTLLRCERRCRIANLGMEREVQKSLYLRFAADIDGAPMVAVDPEMASVIDALSHSKISIVLGDDPQLRLICGVDQLDTKVTPLCQQRFQLQHNTEDSFSLFRLLPETAQLFAGAAVSDIALDVLLGEVSFELRQMERRAVDHMNEDHADAVNLYAEVLLSQPRGNWKMSALDMEGIDLMNEERGIRLWFDPPLRHPKDIKERLVKLAKEARQANAHS